MHDNERKRVKEEDMYSDGIIKETPALGQEFFEVQVHTSFPVLCTS